MFSSEDQGLITSISLQPGNTKCILVSSTSGKLYQVDAADFKKPQISMLIDLEKPIWRIDAATVPNRCLILLETASTVFQLKVCSLDKLLSSDSTDITKLYTWKWFSAEHPETVPFAVSQDYVAFFECPTESHKSGTLIIQSLRNYQTIVKHTTFPLTTSLEYHPTEPYIAVGTKNGNILLVYNFSKKQDSVVSSLNWHAHEVRTIAFSPDGAYMLSGGEEGVLVCWQLETAHKQFFPRLGGALDYIQVSSKGDFYSLSMAQNSIKIFDSVRNKISCVARGLQTSDRRISKQLNDTNVNIVGKGLGTVLFASSTGFLQEFDALDDISKNSLQLVQWNYVSRANSKDSVIAPFKVRFAERFETGELVSVVEEAKGFCQLQFWNHENELMTCMENPHRDTITSLSLDHQNLRCMTTSADGTLKVWHRVSRKVSLRAKEGEEKFSFQNQWELYSAAEYRGMPCFDGTFSQDGSLIAAVFGGTLTLWETEDCLLVNALKIPMRHCGIDRVAFIGDGLILALAEKTGVFVFDCLAMKIQHLIPGDFVEMAVDCSQGRFAVLEESETLKLKVFKVDDKSPLLCQDLLQKCSKPTLAFQKAPEGSNSAVLVSLNNGRSVKRILFEGDHQVKEDNSQLEEVELSLSCEHNELSGAKRKRPVSFDNMLERFTTVRVVDRS
jgi:WD40 repeat protein